MNAKIITLVLIGALTGCGGGGGDEGGSAGDSGSTGDGGTPTPVSSGSDVAAVSETEVELRTMSELSIPDGFSFNPVMGHKFDVDLSSLSTDRAYISIYSEFTQNSDGTYTPNYNSRVTSSSLSAGVASLDFCISEAQEQVLAEVWYYDGSEPVQQTFTQADTYWVW
ncbi:hypothetical protein [Vibrio mexicanus]|uniref:hypothetical protein n=1 Tax=Vibrio mexicanus TaxID=1004326 RepID=UPI00063CA43F|nr:hypothetical protein [Vibrio mexicanus]